MRTAPDNSSGPTGCRKPVLTAGTRWRSAYPPTLLLPGRRAHIPPLLLLLFGFCSACPPAAPAYPVQILKGPDLCSAAHSCHTRLQREHTACSQGAFHSPALPRRKHSCQALAVRAFRLQSAAALLPASLETRAGKMGCRLSYFVRFPHSPHLKAAVRPRRQKPYLLVLMMIGPCKTAYHCGHVIHGTASSPRLTTPWSGKIQVCTFSRKCGNIASLKKNYFSFRY